MMALQILPILQVIVILFTQTSLSYPVYGTKRYGRWPSHPINSQSSFVDPFQQTMLRVQRLPLNYDKLYPYSQGYPDEYYYPQDLVYYPSARTSKYEVYQAVLPYYFEERPKARPMYKYYSYNDPVVDIQEELLQEAEREQRENSQPIGHEMLYENEELNSDDNLDEVNAAFLQNLIMSQMYQDAEKEYYQQQYPEYEDSYGKWDDFQQDENSGNFYQEDEDVKELKQLANINNRKSDQNSHQDINWLQQNLYRPNIMKSQQPGRNDIKNNNNYKRNFKQGVMVYMDRKPIVKEPRSTTVPPVVVSSTQPKREGRGQKEEVLMRPATPVRHPFSSPVLEMMTKNDGAHKRAPSVFDKIKHMLEMEKNSDKNAGVHQPIKKKRMVTTSMDDETLAHQLSVLKKSQRNL